ncbi:MAG TPA: hypothetical protein VKU19_25410 [Bryobacteraceae bacterium]|nr:hypothetical protein [Bryobacteraceae bacterium]
MSQGQPPGIGAPDGDQVIHITEDRIREELSRVLASHEFRSSKRSQDFLRYVIDNTLSGHADLLKERTIGIDVFGRPTSYDPSEDATVRVKAGEVRKRLGLYYSDQGARNPIRIELPSGTYVPEFHANASAAPALVSSAALPTSAIAPAPQHPETPVESKSAVMLRWAGVVVLAIGIAFFASYLLKGPASTVLDEFWAPVLLGNAPVMVGAAYVPVWNLDRDPGASGPASTADYVQLNDQFVGGGDLIATSRITSMFTRLKRPYRLKVGNDVSFPDLRTGPAVLVGYSYTQWKEISSQLRYFIDGARRPVGVTDNGKATQWALPNLPRDRRTSEDYAIVSRVFHPDTHAMLVEIAGITQYGTDAAGDLVTNPDLMAESLHGAPPGWQKKNLQLVLHVKVIAGAPSSPKVVASYFW